MFGDRNSLPAIEMRARHQRSGYLYKLPMSKSTSDKWQKRMFVAKDGFLLYYAASEDPNSIHFNNKPKGVIPLGGCKVDLVERGPKASKLGLKITHPDFLAGRMLVLAAETEPEQKAWLEALNDCSRVTMENAKLGDAMIEKLRAQGTTAEKEKNDVIEQLQEQALALRMEQEEKLKLVENTEELKKLAAEAEERAKKKEEEMAIAMAEVDKHREALMAEAADIQAAVEERNAALAASTAEYEKVQAALLAAANGTLTLSPGSAASVANGELEARARVLEEEKMRLEHEKAVLERSVHDLSSSTEQLQNTLRSAEEQRKQLEEHLREISKAEQDLASERQLRRRLERKLQIAEDSLKRLDEALRRSGVKLDVDVFADVKTLLAFFEERVGEVKRDAQRIDIMKKALKVKRQYLTAAAKTDSAGDDSTLRELEAAARQHDDAWENDNEPVFKVLGTPARATPATTATKAAAPAPAAAATSTSGGQTASYADELGALPEGWTLQSDDTGDRWYFNEKDGRTSWLRPNADGTVPPAE